MVSNSYAVLSPPVVTRVMQDTQNILTLPQALKWYDRAAKPNVSKREMTLKESFQVYASDVIAVDAVAHVREAGQFSLLQHGSNKLKHGVWFSEEMMDLIETLNEGTLGDIGYFTLQSYIGRWAAALELGRKQRAEAMLNGMVADEFNYNRLGIKIEAQFGMKSDLKFVTVEAWRNPDGTVNTDATPIADLVGALFYARRNYGENWNRITLDFAAYSAIPETDEFKNTWNSQAFRYAPSAPGATEAQAANPAYFMTFLGNFITDAMRSETGEAPRPIQIETYDGTYREYSDSGSIDTPIKFHSAENNVIFSDSADDNSMSGWDLGNGPCMEGRMSQILASFGASGVIGTFDGVSPWGPLGYICPSNINMNPPNFQLWNVGWVAPRKHRDTSTGRLKAWPDA